MTHYNAMLLSLESPASRAFANASLTPLPDNFGIEYLLRTQTSHNINYMFNDFSAAPIGNKILVQGYQDSQYPGLVVNHPSVIHTRSKYQYEAVVPNTDYCGVRNENSNSVAAYTYNLTGTTYYYSGIDGWDPGVDLTICRVHAAMLRYGSFDGLGRSVYFTIWSKDGNDLDEVLYETSFPMTDEVSNSGVKFYPFYITPNYTLLNGTTYAFTLSTKAVDSSHYIKTYRGGVSSGLFGITAAWNSSKVRTATNTFRPSFIFYTRTGS